jgi:hypothetical protein
MIVKLLIYKSYAMYFNKAEQGIMIVKDASSTFDHLKR